MADHPDIFIDLRTDYGFKRIFGSEERKGLVIRFLNALFEGEFHVDDVQFHDKEVLGRDSDSKRIIYDIYCTTKEEKKKHFILEMQNVYEPNFADRALYYVMAAVIKQGRKGAEWHYDIESVYSVMFLNFNFRHLSERLVRDVRLIDTKTNEVYSDKMRMIFLAMPEMKKRWADCHTELEQLIYLVKNMEKLDKNSDAYKSKQYDDLFDSCEKVYLSAEELVEYSRSKRRMSDLEYSMSLYKEECRAEGRAEGREEGRVEGREEGRVDVARNLIKMGFAKSDVLKATGISDAQYEALIE